MAKNERVAWQLDSFVDSLGVGLDKVYDTLAIKGINRELAFAVKELSLDLYVYPTFDGKTVRFKTAESGDTGAASKLSLQLGSITKEQIRRTTARPMTKDDLSLEDVEGIEEEVKESFRKHGIKSTRDLKNLEQRNVDVEEIVKVKPGVKKTTYKDLADKINKARRNRLGPAISQVSFSRQAGSNLLNIEGSNLALTPNRDPFPQARLDGRVVPIVQANENNIQIQVDPAEIEQSAGAQLQIALDQFAVIKMNLKTQNQH